MKVVFEQKEYCLYDVRRGYHLLKFIVQNNSNETGLLYVRIVTMYKESVSLTFENQVPFTTNKTTQKYSYDLRNIALRDGLTGLTVGDYEIGIKIGEQPEQFFPLKVVFVTVEQLKLTWCFGASLLASEILSPKLELKEITGIEILEISRNTDRTIHLLKWDAENSTLSWSGGEPIKITESYQEYILPDEILQYGISGGDYMLIKTKFLEDLPEASVDETVIIDQKEIEFNSIQKIIEKATNFTLSYVNIAPEPTYYSTEKNELGAKYFMPAEFTYRPRSKTNKQFVYSGVCQIQKIVSLWGEYAGNRVAYIEDFHTEFSQYGYITIVTPFPSAFNAIIGHNIINTWDRTIYSNHIDHGYINSMPNFWHMQLVAGLVDDEMRQTMLTTIAGIAAIDVLNLASTADMPGVTSESINKDGTTTTTAYATDLNNRKYGPLIKEYRDFVGLGLYGNADGSRGLLQRMRLWGRGSQVAPL